MARFQSIPAIDTIHDFLVIAQQAKRNPPSSLSPWLNDNDGSTAYPRSRASISNPSPRSFSRSMTSSSTATTQQPSIWDTTSDSPASAGTGPSHPHQRGQQRPQRTVDRRSPASNASISVPDPRELTDNALRTIHEQAEMSAAQNPQPTMPCEFARYTGCPRLFCPVTESKQWIRHEIEDHLHDKLPARCLCWFCDDFKFDADATTDGDRRKNFHNRMEHIAGHFREGERGQIRPDFPFLEHLWSSDMITQAVFDREKNRHETPQIEGLRPVNFKTSRMVREEERRSRVIVQDDPRREREWRRSRRQKDKV